MDEQEKEYFTQLLRKQLAGNSHTSEFLKKTINEHQQEFSRYPLHMADQGTDTNNLEFAGALSLRADKYKDRIVSALERINNGTYGICRCCESPISKERLEAVPTTNICINCKKNGE